jgi:integrative and conjugative element protein (TIGR02256 family)
VTDTPAPGSGALTFARSDGSRFEISPAVVELLGRFAQHLDTAPESGGVLLGRRITGTDDVIVDAATTPMEGDTGLRFRFVRASAAHQDAADRAWRDSGGTCAHLGGWHTHPERRPSPSHTDRSDWRRQVAGDPSRDVLFFVIVGTEEVRAWECRRGARLARLAPIHGR